MLKTIRNTILAIPCINNRVQALKNEQEAKRIEQEEKLITDQLERYHQHWTLMLSDQAMRGNESDHRTLVDVTDDGVIVSYMNGRAVGQEHAGPVFIDSVEWGVG